MRWHSAACATSISRLPAKRARGGARTPTPSARAGRGRDTAATVKRGGRESPRISAARGTNFPIHDTTRLLCHDVDGHGATRGIVGDHGPMGAHGCHWESQHNPRGPRADKLLTSALVRGHLGSSDAAYTETLLRGPLDLIQNSVRMATADATAAIEATWAASKPPGATAGWPAGPSDSTSICPPVQLQERFGWRNGYIL